jgi:radical SAM superfamily enzyme YgiQ (UPF0313 family)
MRPRPAGFGIIAKVNVLLLSTYELGHQPLALAWPAAALRAAGHTVRCIDLALDELDAEAVRTAELVGLSVPMHTALRLGVRVARRVRVLNRRAHLCAYGLYASLNADYLLRAGVDSLIGGEVETPLVALADWLAAGRTGVPPAGVWAAGRPAGPFLARQEFELPARDLLPPLARYVRLDDGVAERLTGYVEASRGCVHECRHCPITPVYGGRLRIVPAELVLADIDALVAQGATHITFGDPDFLNGVRHSLAIVRRLHAAHPRVTFDFTARVEHLLERRALLPELRALGCAFVLSAVESLSDTVLANLDKGHSGRDARAALAAARAAGLSLRPSFVAFTPWTTLEDYLELLAFVASEALWDHVDPVQYAIRLLIPPGSSLLGTPGLAPYLESFQAELLTYDWRYADPRMAALYPPVAAAVEQGVRAGDEPRAIFAAVAARADAAAGRGRPRPAPPPRPAGRRPPRLTESWFC